MFIGICCMTSQLHTTATRNTSIRVKLSLTTLSPTPLCTQRPPRLQLRCQTRTCIAAKSVVELLSVCRCLPPRVLFSPGGRVLPSEGQVQRRGVLGHLCGRRQGRQCRHWGARVQRRTRVHQLLHSRLLQGAPWGTTNSGEGATLRPCCRLDCACCRTSRYTTRARYYDLVGGNALGP